MTPLGRTYVAPFGRREFGIGRPEISVQAIERDGQRQISFRGPAGGWEVDVDDARQLRDAIAAAVADAES